MAPLGIDQLTVSGMPCFHFEDERRRPYAETAIQESNYRPLCVCEHI
jgi:hypothetical protein